MSKLFCILSFLYQTLLFAQSDTIYNIRGNAWFVDANKSLFLGQWRTNSVVPIQHGIYENVVANGDTAIKSISLTFDDAPDDEYTDKLLEILKENDIKASFFMIGEKMEDKNIAVVKRVYDDGHLVLSHSYSHPRMTDLNASSIATQLNRTSQRIEEITGSYPMLFRPPYGALNSLAVDTTNDHNMTTVLWSLDSLDWATNDPEPVIQIVTGNIHSGDIILMHCSSTTVGSLPTIIKKLKEQGYKFVKLDDMLKIKAYRQKSSEVNKWNFYWWLNKLMEK